MTKSATINMRIEPHLKDQAESVFSSLGLKTSDAITMFYTQVVLNKGIPFDLRIPNKETIDAIAEPREGLIIYSDPSEMMKDILSESD